MLVANVAIPTIFPHWIMAFFVLVPVILIEARVAQRRLAVPFNTAFTICRRANVRSMLIGIPCAYFMALFVTLPFAAVVAQFTQQNKALSLYLGNVFLMGGIADSPPVELSFLATAIMLVPYYYASVLIESRSMQRSLPSADPALVRSTATAMNRVSYGLLFLLCFVLFLLGICGWAK